MIYCYLIHVSSAEGGKTRRCGEQVTRYVSKTQPSVLQCVLSFATEMQSCCMYLLHVRGSILQCGACTLTIPSPPPPPHTCILTHLQRLQLLRAITTLEKRYVLVQLGYMYLPNHKALEECTIMNRL